MQERARPPSTGVESAIGIVHVEPQSDAIVAISLEGEFDLSNASLVREQAQRALDDNKNLILDLSKTSFIDLAVIHAVTDAAAAAERSGQVAILQLGTAPIVELALELTDIEEVVPRVRNRNEALEAIQQLTARSGETRSQ